jgi:hypothetical protein
MEYIHGTLIYLASQPARPQQVRDAITSWAARHAEFDHAPDVVEVPPGKYDPVNPAMIVHLWFGNDVVTDRAESLNAWNTIQALSLAWVQPGSKIERGTDTPTVQVFNTRTF